MSQLSYETYAENAFDGLKVNTMFDHVETSAATSEVLFGRGVGALAGNTEDVHYPSVDVAAHLFDADFVTGNSIVITVNGVASASVDFLTDHATTGLLVLAAIQDIPAVTSAAITDGATAREFTVTTGGSTITVSSSVTGGASQATGSSTNTGNDLFRGIALHTHKVGGKYLAKDAVNVLRKGQAWVTTTVAVTADQSASVDVAGSEGKFTNVSSSNLATNGVFRSTSASAGRAILEINLP